ncbi:hypothetical protein [Histidinibacterium aquaticum]|nr:hypothetical protein [Histidinibacterium aquaticum]
MTQDIRTAIQRSKETILGDAIGALSIAVMLLVGLSLPGLT